MRFCARAPAIAIGDDRKKLILKVVNAPLSGREGFSFAFDVLAELFDFATQGELNFVSVGAFEFARSRDLASRCGGSKTERQ